MTIRTMIVDDQPVARCGLMNILEGSEFDMRAHAGSLDEARRLDSSESIDLIVTELVLGGRGIADAVEQLVQARPQRPVLILSASNHAPLIRAAQLAGAAGYVHKSSSPQKLLAAMRKCASGEKAWPISIVRRITAALATPRQPLDEPVDLTQREFEVLVRMGRGWTNREIARDLGIGYETAKEHVQHLMRKLGASDRTQAALWAVRQGYL